MSDQEFDDLMDDLTHASKTAIELTTGVCLTTDDLDKINDFFSDFVTRIMEP